MVYTLVHFAKHKRTYVLTWTNTVIVSVPISIFVGVRNPSIAQDESSLLTTFSGPFGCYLYFQLPFSVVMIQDMFLVNSLRIAQVGTANDVIFFSTSEEHDKNLHLMQAAQEYGIMFNTAKCTVKWPKWVLWYELWQHGLHPGPGKVAAIKEINAPY